MLALNSLISWSLSSLRYILSFHHVLILFLAILYYAFQICAPHPHYYLNGILTKGVAFPPTTVGSFPSHICSAKNCKYSGLNDPESLSAF